MGPVTKRSIGPWTTCTCALAWAGLGLTGCAEPDPTPAPGVAPRLEPPPPKPGALSEARVLELSSRAQDAADAIRLIDARPLAFPLDQEHLDRLGAAGIDPDVLDYLRRRARVDWESLRGDIPDPPPEGEY